MQNIAEPLLIEKGEAKDNRGSVEFYNSLNLDMFRRLYIVSNPVDRTVRAWHGHKIESKLVKVLKGKFLVCTVKIDNWDNPDKNALIDEIEMDQDSGILYIPPGYANGAINLVSDSKVMYFSSLNLEESIKDDHRFNSNFWDPWDKYSPEIYE